MSRLPALLLFGLLASACSYVLPASWRSFRADPDDIVPAVTRALAAADAQIDNIDEAGRKITSGWNSFASGVDRRRERYVVSWNRDDDDASITVYVRHEQQDHEGGERPGFGSVYHDGSKEDAMLNAITKELKAAQKSIDG